MSTAKPVTLEHEGKTYSAQYVVKGNDLTVHHGGASKFVTLHGLPAESTARQILWEIVVRDGKGKAD